MNRWAVLVTFVLLTGCVSPGGSLPPKERTGVLYPGDSVNIPTGPRGRNIRYVCARGLLVCRAWGPSYTCTCQVH